MKKFYKLKKDIDKLNLMIVTLSNRRKLIEQLIYHQVCDEIKREIANLENIELSSYMTLCNIIDKIEQGE